MISAESVSPREVAILRAAELMARATDWLTFTMLRVINGNPIKVRLNLAALFLIVSVMGYTHTAHAGAILDPIITSINGATGNWMQGSLDLANAIFATLVLITALYMTVAYFVEFRTFVGLAPTLIKLLLSLGIPFVVINATRVALLANCGQSSGLVCSAQQVWAAITGQGVFNATPDSIVLTFLNLGWTFPTTAWQKISTMGLSIFDPAPLLLAGIVLVISILIAVVIIGVGLFLAIELLVATLQATFSLPLAAWTLGFAGAPATAPMASPFWGVVLKQIIRYLAILAMVSAATSVANGWNTAVATTVFNNVAPGIDVGVLKPAIQFFLGALALAYLAKDLPQHAVAALTGTPVITGSRAVSGASSAAGAAGSTAQSAAKGAGSVGSGGGHSDGAAATAGLARGGLAGAAGALIANRINRK